MVSVFQRRQVLFGFGLLVGVSLALLYFPSRPDVSGQELPERLADAEFWDLVTEFSEAGGSFRSDNLVSNESAFQRVIPQLKKKIKPGGVYLGVGPEQNFTYIAALGPKLAFVIDIRRENMLLHLMYKALFELSSDRTEFLSNLFARPLTTDLPKTVTTEELFRAFAEAVSDSDLARRNLDATFEHLHDRHHFDLRLEDSRTIERIYNAFVSAGPEIRYSISNQYTGWRFPSYSELMLETDGTTEYGGENHSYMASESNFQIVKRMQAENRIIPIVGDFAGEKALRSVGRYIQGHGARVTTFYTSNVEFYLFQIGDWRRFFETVSDLPLNADSVFIRSYFNNYRSQFPNPPAWLDSTPQSYTLLDSMPAFVNAFTDRHIDSYFDVIRRSKP
jgi:hypothetical protein